MYERWWNEAAEKAKKLEAKVGDIANSVSAHLPKPPAKRGRGRPRKDTEVESNPVL